MLSTGELPFSKWLKKMQLTNIFMCSFKEGELTVDICEHLVLEQCVQICVLSLSFSSEKVKEAYF